MSLTLRLTFSGDGGNTFAASMIVPGSSDPELGFNGSQQKSDKKSLFKF